MKIGNRNRKPRGYVSYVMVLSLGIVVLMLLINTYKTSMRSHETQREVGLRVDYSDKEDEILRAVVNIVPNRAILAMVDDSNASSSNRNPLRWSSIFSDALDQANARESISDTLLGGFGLANAVTANQGDTSFTNVNAVFDAIEPESGYVAPGIGRILGEGFPVPLESSNSTLVARDRIYPIISDQKKYGLLATGGVGLSTEDYPDFNLIPFPEIRFAYCEPGQPFVAKRNWWAFSLDLADADDDVTGMDRMERDFIVSIYEVPSQLAISAEAFAILGEHEDGTVWKNTTVDGGVYGTRVRAGAGLSVPRLTGRRDVKFDSTVTIGEHELTDDPFAPGARESFELDHGEFMPVSLASEAGRAAFLPINRGPAFFDRYVHSQESQTLSPTTWNDYSVGANQCAMRLDITDAVSDTDNMPSALRFQYFKNGVRETLELPLFEDTDTGLPPGFIYCADENQTVSFPYPVDLAYGKNGSYYYEEGASGVVTFDNARFGDPLVGTFKAGYYRPSYPFTLRLLHDHKWCIVVFPERVKACLELLGADGPEVNHSLAVNVDYPGSAYLDAPSIPCKETDYGVLLEECGDLSDFSKGFSLVTNLRLYIADDFNTVSVAPPETSGLPSPYYPPCSLFAPEKRYGAEADPYHLTISGQVGSLAGEEGEGGKRVHLLDLKNASEDDVAHDQVSVNLSQIRHPAALPPITMMNWLILVEERRAELYVSDDP